MIAGDFNIQYFYVENEKVDTDQFQNMMEAMSLVQHKNFSTHNSGNTIDVLFSEMVGQLKIESVKCCEMFSDHTAISQQVKFEKLDMKLNKKKTIQNWRKVDVKNFYAGLKLDELNYECEKLAKFIYLYNDRIISGLNDLVPLKKSSNCIKRQSTMVYGWITKSENHS